MLILVHCLIHIQYTYASVRDTIISGAQVLLMELFTYKPEVLTSQQERERMIDISRAFGLLLYHFKDECWKEFRPKFRNKVNDYHL